MLESRGQGNLDDETRLHLEIRAIVAERLLDDRGYPPVPMEIDYYLYDLQETIGKGGRNSFGAVLKLTRLYRLAATRLYEASRKGAVSGDVGSC